MRVSETREFRIAGLLGGQNLTIRGAEDGGLVFGVDGGALSRRLSWRSDGLDGEREEEGKGEGREAWCVSGEWSVGTTGMSRERRLHCAFPCEKIFDKEGGGDERADDENERVELR